MRVSIPPSRLERPMTSPEVERGVELVGRVGLPLREYEPRLSPGRTSIGCRGRNRTHESAVNSGASPPTDKPYNVGDDFVSSPPPTRAGRTAGCHRAYILVGYGQSLERCSTVGLIIKERTRRRFAWIQARESNPDSQLQRLRRHLDYLE